mgnify:CR=1 FL=1
MNSLQFGDFISSKDMEAETSLSLNEMTSYLEEHGFSEYEMETNGWQVDYWVTSENDKVKVTLSGCLFYSNTVKVTKEYK